MVAWLTLWGVSFLPLLGAAIAVVVVWGLAWIMKTDTWTTVGRLLEPPGALGRALVPILLPVIVISTFAAAVLSPLLQLASGALLIALIWLLVRGKGEFTHERQNSAALTRAISPTTPFPPWYELAIPALIGVAAALAFLAASFGNPIRTWEGPAGWSGFIEYGALALLAGALATRIFGYATNRWRVIVAIALTVFVVRILSAVGVYYAVPGAWSALHFTAGRALVLLVIVVAAFAMETWSLRNTSPSAPGSIQQFARAGGVWVASASAVLLAIALLAATVETTAGAGQLSSDRFGEIHTTPTPAIVDTPGDADLDLAWTFAPVLHLDHDEDYPPVGVDTFLAGASEAGAKKSVSPTGEPLPLNDDTLPTECPGGENYACGTLRCTDCISRKKETQPVGFVPQGILYARIAHRDSEPRVFSGWNPWGDDLQTLIQYWVFYAYDRWQAETVMGSLIQEHEGDWEMISVGLDVNEAPLFVALSAHCGGQVVPWGDVSAAPGTLVGGRVMIAKERIARDVDVSHPIVAVAKGSHANYAVSGGHRPPDWGSCKQLPSDAVSALSYASNVRDITDDTNTGWFASPKDIVAVTDKTRPMSYPGAWGTGEFMTFGHHEKTRSSNAPLSPPLQTKSWHTPIKLFFCQSHWHPAGEGSEHLHGTKRGCKA